jgi:outer membrane protein assembly factor BamB
MVLGNAGNTCVASVAASLRGKTQWSIPLTSEWRYRIVVGEDGSLFVASSTLLLALDPGGQVRWRRSPTGDGGFGAPIALADGTIFLTSDGGRRLVWWDQATGAEHRSIAGEWGGLAITDAGDIIIRRESPEGRGGELCSLGSDGVVRWSHPLAKIGGPALVVGNRIVIADGSYWAAFDTDGNFLWLANRHGFVFGDQAKDVPRVVDDEHFWTVPMRLDESRIIGGYTHYSGHEFLILDPSKGTVAACENSGRPFPSDGPVVITPGREPHMACADGNALQVFDNSGKLLFERRVPWAIINIVSDSIGNLIVTEGVDPDYWSKYKDAYSLHDACGVVGFDPKGNQLFRWTAPGPMGAALAIGKMGEIYCVSEGRLWAIA